MVYHLHLTAPRHIGTTCYSTKMTLTRKYFKDSAFPTPSSYSVLLVLPKKKKKVESFDVPETLEEAVKKGATVLN